VIVIAVLLQLGYQASREYSRIHEVIGLVSVNLLQSWFLGMIPSYFRLVILFLILYGLAVFAQKFSQAVDLYNFVMISLTPMIAMENVPIWVQGVGMFLVWSCSYDTVTKTVARLTIVHFVQVFFMQTVQSVGRVDGLLVYTILLVGLEFINSSLNK
jgi:hypothetical protein